MLSAYPFELCVARMRAVLGRGRQGYIDALAGLVVGCKAKQGTGEKLGNEDEDSESGWDNEEAQEDEKAEEGHQADPETLGANDEADDTLATAEVNLSLCL